MAGIVVWWYFQRAELKLNHVYRTYKIFMQSPLKKNKEEKERERSQKEVRKHHYSLHATYIT